MPVLSGDQMKHHFKTCHFYIFNIWETYCWQVTFKWFSWLFYIGFIGYYLLALHFSKSQILDLTAYFQLNNKKLKALKYLLCHYFYQMLEGIDRTSSSLTMLFFVAILAVP